MAQVSLENTVINVAAVDPATYRSFTPSQSAELQELWTRVAGGEVAVLPELQKKLPLDAQGYLRLGNSRDAPRAHVGAYAPQIPAGRRGRQRGLDPDARHEGRQRADHLHRPHVAAVAAQADRAAGRRPTPRCR